MDLAHLNDMISSARKRREQVADELRHIDEWIVTMQEQAMTGADVAHAANDPHHSISEQVGRG